MGITGTENHRRINRVEAGGGNDRKETILSFCSLSLLSVLFPPWELQRRRVQKQSIPILIPCDIKRCWPESSYLLSETLRVN